MTTTLECEKCGSQYKVKVFSTVKHTVKCKCPYCRYEETLEVGVDE